MLSCLFVMSTAQAAEITIRESDDEIHIETPFLKAAIRKTGYVSGVARESLRDKISGFHDAGFGLDIADWIMEPGSDKSYRKQLDPELVYRFGNPYHGQRAKRSIEGPQICTQAKRLNPRIIRGKRFVAIEQSFRYRTSAPGRKTGSTWTQRLVFPDDTRYFISMDRIDSVNDSDAMFLRLDLPGHIRHQQGDTFQQVYLSYQGLIPASAFRSNFAPDEQFNYRRDEHPTPQRFVRAYQLRDRQTGQAGPWLAGMTLDPTVVHEAWCHQRGYVCMIEEIGGRPIKAGQSFSAAFIVGYFDDITQMHQVYDRYRDHSRLEVDTSGWKLH
ncbi:MAG: hypothetical protein ABGZ17_08585 [Planctomycetaceae bacterium]